MAQHTPGPWTYDRSSGYIGTNDGVIAKIQSSAGWAGIGKNIPASEQEENGRYIVRACNAHEELLEALQDCLTSDESVGVRMKDPEKLIRRLHVINDRVNEAIAKAEGNNTHA